MQRREFGFIFGECHIVYRSPAHYDERIRTEIRPASFGQSSLRLEFEMRVDGDDRLVAEGYGVLVGHDYRDGGSQPLPDERRDRLRAQGAAESDGRSAG